MSNIKLAALSCVLGFLLYLYMSHTYNEDNIIDSYMQITRYETNISFDSALEEEFFQLSGAELKNKFLGEHGLEKIKFWSQQLSEQRLKVDIQNYFVNNNKYPPENDVSAFRQKYYVEYFSKLSNYLEDRKNFEKDKLAWWADVIAKFTGAFLAYTIPIFFIIRFLFRKRST